MAFLTLFLKVICLQGRVSNTSAGNWFQCWMVNSQRVFPYVRPLPSTPNFPFVIYPAQIVWPF
jgi:hypothetical protein